MKLRYLCSLLLLLSVIACDDDEMMTPMQADQIRFGGIYATDVNGLLLGNGDPTEWQLLDEWEDQIADFFADGQTNLCSDTTNNQTFPAFPNPGVDEISLQFNLKDSADLELRIVNRDYQVLKEIAVTGVFSSGFNQLRLNLDELNVSNDTVRVYYKIIRPDCELRGHGDIAIQ